MHAAPLLPGPLPLLQQQEDTAQAMDVDIPVGEQVGPQQQPEQKQQKQQQEAAPRLPELRVPSASPRAGPGPGSGGPQSPRSPRPALTTPNNRTTRGGEPSAPLLPSFMVKAVLEIGADG